MGFRQVEAAGNFDPHSQEKSLEPTCCRFFSVTNLTALRKGQESGEATDTLSRNPWDSNEEGSYGEAETGWQLQDQGGEKERLMQWSQDALLR